MRTFKSISHGIILFFSGLTLAACASQSLPPGGQVTESVITACSGYATVLTSLTPFKPKLSASDVATINKSIALTMPICSDPSSYNTSGAVAAIVAETSNLKNILKGVKP